MPECSLFGELILYRYFKGLFILGFWRPCSRRVLSKSPGASRSQTDLSYSEDFGLKKIVGKNITLAALFRRVTPEMFSGLHTSAWM